MNLNAHAIALWLGIAASASAVYFPIHSQLKDGRDQDVKQAQNRQQRIDALNQRISNDEADIAYIKAQLPKDKQDVLDAIQKVRQNQASTEVLMYEKSAMPHIAADTPKTERPEVIADRPRVEIPQQPLDQPKE